MESVEKLTTWLEGRMPELDVRMLEPQEDHLVWRIDRPGEGVSPAFLKVPADYLRSGDIGKDDIADALDEGRLKARVLEADRDTEAAFLLTREPAGPGKAFVLTGTEPPAEGARSYRQPPDAPGPVPR